MDALRLNIVSGNILMVDGQILQAAEHSPEHLDSVLKVGREVITQAISQMYEKTIAKEEDSTRVQRGSVLAMRLGAKTLDVIERDYYYANYTSLDYSDEGLKPRYREYYEVVRDNQLIPEVREIANVAGLTELAGVVLAVKDTPPQ